MSNPKPAIYNVTCTVADTEYSQKLGDVYGRKIKEFTIKARNPAHTLRYAYVSGKVATPTEPYMTIPSGQSSTPKRINNDIGLLYVASPDAGAVAEIEVLYR